MPDATVIFNHDRWGLFDMGDGALGYRRDIDGLRAVAIAAVVFYHLFPNQSRYGYVGVDIFFVISGFLVTGVLLRTPRLDRASIAIFYQRRIRRIMPALLAMLLVTTLACSVLLLPSELVDYGWSVTATLAFISNIYFWRHSAYFALEAASRPILNCWSLGVEEQFYLVFPLVLRLVARDPRRRFWLIALLSAGSLLIAVLAVWVNKSSVGFYLLPARAWQLGLGCLCALRSPGARWTSAGRGIVAGLGAALVALALMGVDWLGTEPLWHSLAAASGTVLLIAANTHRESWTARLLGMRGMVGLGLISYSLYLWHWPINVLARYWLIREPTTAERFAILAVSLALAVASWRWVERPFRQPAMPIGRVIAGVAGLSVILVSAAAIFIAFDGLPARVPELASRFNAQVNSNYRCPPSEAIAFGALYGCPINPAPGGTDRADVVLVGDSHAIMYAPALAAALRARGMSGILAPSNDCLPTVDVNVSQVCAATMDANLAAAERLPDVKLVILATFWHHLSQPLVVRGGAAIQSRGWEAIRPAFEATIARLRRAGKQVAIVGPLATPDVDLASIAGRELAFGRPIDVPLSRDRASFDREYEAVEQWLGSRADVIFIDPRRVQCDRLRCAFTQADVPIFADSNHLAVSAAPMFAPIFAAALDEAMVARGRRRG